MSQNKYKDGELKLKDNIIERHAINTLLSLESREKFSDEGSLQPIPQATIKDKVDPQLSSWPKVKKARSLTQHKPLTPKKTSTNKFKQPKPVHYIDQKYSCQQISGTNHIDERFMQRQLKESQPTASSGLPKIIDKLQANQQYNIFVNEKDTKPLEKNFSFGKIEGGGCSSNSEKKEMRDSSYIMKNPFNYSEFHTRDDGTDNSYSQLTHDLISPYNDQLNIPTPKNQKEINKLNSPDISQSQSFGYQHKYSQSMAGNFAKDLADLKTDFQNSTFDTGTCCSTQIKNKPNRLSNGIEGANYDMSSNGLYINIQCDNNCTFHPIFKLSKKSASSKKKKPMRSTKYSCHEQQLKTMPNESELFEKKYKEDITFRQLKTEKAVGPEEEHSFRNLSLKIKKATPKRTYAERRRTHVENIRHEKTNYKYRQDNRIMSYADRMDTQVKIDLDKSNLKDNLMVMEEYAVQPSQKKLKRINIPKKIVAVEDESQFKKQKEATKETSGPHMICSESVKKMLSIFKNIEKGQKFVNEKNIFFDIRDRMKRGHSPYNDYSYTKTLEEMRNANKNKSEFAAMMNKDIPVPLSFLKKRQSGGNVLNKNKFYNNWNNIDRNQRNSGMQTAGQFTYEEIMNSRAVDDVVVVNEFQKQLNDEYYKTITYDKNSIANKVIHDKSYSIV